MRSDYDIIIVGGSVAGACSAIALAPEGYRILLLDRAIFPRDKACGEGIMPQGVAVLESLGVLPEILAHGAVKARGMRYRNLRGQSARADFPPCGEEISFCLVIRRLHLDHLLLRRAESFPNVTVRQGFKVTEVIQENWVVRGVVGQSVHGRAEREAFHAPLTIGADGRNSVFHATCGLTKTYLPRRRFGVTGHVGGVEGIGPYVEVLLHPHGECYIAPCGGDVHLVALLLEEKAMPYFSRDLRQRYIEFLKSVGDLRERASCSELAGDVFAIGPLGFTVVPIHRPGFLLVGDSAGFLDPITGEGMTLALKSVQAAVPLIKEAFAAGQFGTELGRQYADERFQVAEDIFRFTQLVLRLSRYKSVADRMIRRLGYDEALFQKLLGIVAGKYRYADLSLLEKAQLMMG